MYVSVRVCRRHFVLPCNERRVLLFILMQQGNLYNKKLTSATTITTATTTTNDNYNYNDNNSNSETWVTYSFVSTYLYLIHCSSSPDPVITIYTFFFLSLSCFFPVSDWLMYALFLHIFCTTMGISECFICIVRNVVFFMNWEILGHLTSQTEFSGCWDRALKSP